ncbi:MDR family oxidoreductase [Alkalimarinus alittae]|uniref:Oxidoreductase n=1 Tax=Alkalimarinus alittae TaxID=2961619 RepID=A0ABY6N3N6_9ALTE|nr:MDR family oxidoreductase [Alkalimarinus alittae]UZE96617.1 oxidoreductase [Alkalimarinus alittae]
MTQANSDQFKALVLRQEDGKTLSAVEQLSIADLPEGDVLLSVDYSSVNYKDSMAVTGTGKIVRTWPMVPGIDLTGTVIESQADSYKPGDKVLLTGWSVGEQYWGGYSQIQRVQSKWLIPLPNGIDSKIAMAIGTAGLTAMLCVMALEDAFITPGKGPIVVTGAGGGVGSIAVAILNKLGYSVTAVSGRSSTHDYLKSLGANDIIPREDMLKPSRPLEAQRWAGAVDTAGDAILARVLAETDYNGAVAACGLAAGYKLPTTVMPFILRNVRLQGVDSVMCPNERRQVAWKRLAQDLPETALTEINRVVSLEEIKQVAEDMMAGKIQGRTVVDLNA